MKKTDKPARCLLWHIPGEWRKIENPDHYLTPEMYQMGVVPTHVRSCPCGRVQELKVEQHP